jgi:fructose-bisphosphate aldolase, class II
MPLTPIRSELIRAQQGGYALPLFDAFDSSTADGMFAALEDCRAPAMIALYTALLEKPNARALVAYLLARAQDAGVPVSIMLDHGSSFEVCIRALRWGFTDVMYDGSSLPLDDNIANTRQVVRAAHAAGVGVEAELGHVGQGSEYADFGSQRRGFTNPDDVERFVAETGVDFLAVAIGSAHGQYQGEPKLDLDLLVEIRRRVDIPLVMHGGSGLSREQFHAAITGGIAKINIATDLFLSAGQRMMEESKTGRASYFSLTQAGVEGIRARSADHLEMFGASGRA